MPAASGRHRPGLLPAACGFVLMLAAPGAAVAGSTAVEAGETDCIDLARRAEQMFGIPPYILQGIVAHESGNHPLALNIDGRAVFPADRPAAVAELSDNLGQAKNIDVGCAQISMRFHGDYFAIKPEIAFDPWINIVYASKILLDNFHAYHSWTEAVARYHSPNRDRQVDYLCRVLGSMTRVADSDLSSTPVCDEIRGTGRAEAPPAEPVPGPVAAAGPVADPAPETAPAPAPEAAPAAP